MGKPRKTNNHFSHQYEAIRLKDTNKARLDLGLVPITPLKRKCLRCPKTFVSYGNFSCPSCNKYADTNYNPMFDDDVSPYL